MVNVRRGRSLNSPLPMDVKRRHAEIGAPVCPETAVLYSPTELGVWRHKLQTLGALETHVCVM